MPCCPAWPQQAPGQQASTHNSHVLIQEREESLNHDRIKDNLRSLAQRLPSVQKKSIASPTIFSACPLWPTICTPTRTESN
ncbi:hypothetical protein PO909_032794 [Leuciscus waleckii]